jgi:FixJ family two-component response regulator
MNDKNKMKPKPLIAVVDDDSSLRESTQLLLRSAGYRAEVFASAREFLDSPRIDETACLLLDVRMPGMDGLELQRFLNEAQRQIPIIFITAHATDNAEQRARKAGAVDFLRKPVNDEKLLSAIQTALKGWKDDERRRQ